MKSYSSFALLACTMLSGCVGVPEEGAPPVRAQRMPRAAAVEASAGSTAGAAPLESAVDAQVDVRVDAPTQEPAVAIASERIPAKATATVGVRLDQLSLWQDPSFQRRLTESYIAATDVEPPLLAVERERIAGILQLLGSDKAAQAEAQLEKFRGPASSATFDFMLANLHFQREELDDAVEDYLRAVDKYPNFRRAWANLALVHARKNDYQNTVRAFTRVIELGGGDSLTYGLLGIAYSNAQRFVGAESAFRIAALLDPDSIDWRVGLADSLARQERYSDAIAVFEGLIAEDPSRADLWFAQAKALLRAGRTAHAAENLEVVASLGGATTDAMYLLGDIYTNDGLYDLAADVYVRALELDPMPEVARALRAVAGLVSRDANQQASRLIDRFEGIVSNEHSTEDRREVLRLRARIAMALGHGDQHVALLEEIVLLDPLDAGALILLGEHFGSTGESERAALQFERAAEVEGFEAAAKLSHARMLVRAGKYGEALPLLRRVGKLDERGFVQRFIEQVERNARGG